MSTPTTVKKIVRRLHPGKLSSLCFTTERLPYTGTVKHALDLDNSDVRTHHRTACLRQIVLYQAGGTFQHFSEAKTRFVTLEEEWVTCPECKSIIRTMRQKALAKRRGYK